MMKKILHSGMSDGELVYFFQNPFEKISISEIEGNRLFEIEISSQSSGSICAYSEMRDIAERDEVGVIGFRKGTIEGQKSEIVIGADSIEAISLHRIVGEFGDAQSCDCGLIIEFDHGMISILSGSFPASINLMCPWFNQGLMVHSFQRFKYYTSQMKKY